MLAAEWRYIIRSWFSEVSLFPGLGSIARYRYTPGTGHYTQMVWSSVSRVGCGYITYRNTQTEPLIARYTIDQPHSIPSSSHPDICFSIFCPH